MTKQTQREQKSRASRKPRPKKEGKEKPFSPEDKLAEAEQSIHTLSTNIDTYARQVEQLRQKREMDLDQRQALIGYAQACREMLGLDNPPDPARPFRPVDKDEQPEPSKPELGVEDGNEDGSKEGQTTD